MDRHTGPSEKRLQTSQGEPVIKPEQPLQNILVRNLDTMQGNSIATSSIRYTQRMAEGNTHPTSKNSKYIGKHTRQCIWYKHR